MRTIGVCLSTRADHSETTLATNDYRLSRFLDIDSLAQAAERQAVYGALVDIDGWAEYRLHSLRRIGSMVPLAIRLSTSPASCRYFARSHSIMPHAFFSDVRVESMESALALLLDTPQSRGAQHLVLEYLHGPVPSSIALLLFQAILVTHRQTSVARLAELCRVAPRTVEWRLASHGFPPARTVLGVLTSLHVIWSIDTLGWSLKRTAVAAGFRSAAALSGFVQRHTGVRPARYGEAGGATALVQAFARLLDSARPSCVAAGAGDADQSASPSGLQFRLRSGIDARSP
jgi:hypothetical protein